MSFQFMRSVLQAASSTLSAVASSRDSSKSNVIGLIYYTSEKDGTNVKLHVSSLPHSYAFLDLERLSDTLMAIHLTTVSKTSSGFNEEMYQSSLLADQDGFLPTTDEKD